jgi:hypothetical protein
MINIHPSAQVRFYLDLLAFVVAIIYVFFKRRDFYESSNFKRSSSMLFIGGILFVIAIFNVSFDQGRIHFSYNTDFILYQNNGEIFSRYCRSLGYIFPSLGMLDFVASIAKKIKSEKVIKNA